MAQSKNSFLSALASSVTSSGTVPTAALAPEVTADIEGAGTAVYDSASLLPISGNTAGDTAFVKSTSRLYIHSGVGWYNVAVINNTPTVQSITDSDGGTTPFALATDGTPTTITITAQDSDGDPLTYNYSADSDFAGLATLSQDANVFTITPLSQDSATTESGTITFTVTDGINTATPGTQTFTLDFISPDWKDVLLSISYNDAIAYQTSNNDNSVFVDRSTNAHTVTPSGDPIQTAFHPYLDNWSVEFDGTNDYIQVAHESGFDFGTGDFTVELWANFQQSNIIESLVGTYANNGADGWLLQKRDNGTIKWWKGSTEITSGTFTPTIGTWHHIAASRESGTVKLFIDGTQVASTSHTADLTYTQPLTIGKLNHTTAPQWCNNHMTNLRIVKGTALYTSAFTPSTEALTNVTGTTFLGLKSNSFINEVNSSSSFTIYDAPKVSAFNPFGQESEYTSGENKGSVDINGDRLDISSSDVGSFGTADYTVQFWIYKRDTSNDCIIDLRGGDLNHGVSVEMDTRVTVFYGGSPFQDTGSFNNFAWNHIAICRASGTLRGFINGEQIFSVADTNNRNSTEYTSKIGVNYSNAQPTNAILSDIKVSHVAEYTSAFTPPTEPVGNTNAKLYLPMDNAGFFDKTGNCELTLGTYTSSTARSTGAYEMATHYGYYGQLEVELPVSLGDLEFTIEWWARQSVSNNGNQTVFEAGDATNGVKVRYEDVRSKLETIVSGTSSTGTSSSKTFYNVLYHHALTRQSDGSFRLYRNGVLIVTNTNNVTIPGNTVKFGSIAGYMEGMQILIDNVKYTTSGYTVPTGIQGRKYQATS